MTQKKMMQHKIQIQMNPILIQNNSYNVKGKSKDLPFIISIQDVDVFFNNKFVKLVFCE